MIIPSESRAMVRTQTVLLCLLFAATLCSASTPFQGGRAGGMASAFVGLADDSSAIAHNPAGLAFVDGTYLYAGDGSRPGDNVHQPGRRVPGN